MVVLALARTLDELASHYSDAPTDADPVSFLVLRAPRVPEASPLIVGHLEYRPGIGKGWRYAPFSANGQLSRRFHARPWDACRGRGPKRDDRVLTRREAIGAGLLRAD